MEITTIDIGNIKDGSIPVTYYEPIYEFYMRRKGTLYFRGEFGQKINFKIIDKDAYVNNLKYGTKLHLQIEK